MRRRMPIVAVVAAVMLVTPSVRAADKFFSWAASTNTWDITSAFWGTTPGGPYNATWSASDDATFEGAAGAVSISNTQTANSVTFATNGYTITNGTMMLASPATITNAVNGIISSVIAGTAGLAKTGSGTLTLTGANTYTGGTTVNSGVLNVGGGGTSGSIPSGSLTVAPGATLAYDYSSGFTATPLSVAGNLEYRSGGILSISGAYGADQLTMTSTASRVSIDGNLTLTAGAGGATITGPTEWGIYSGGSRSITTTGNVTFVGVSTIGSFYGGIEAAGVYTATAGTLTFDGTAAPSGGFGFENGVSGNWAAGIVTFGNVVFKGTGGTTRNCDLSLGGLSGNGTVTVIGRLKGLNTGISFTSSGGLPYVVVIQTTAGNVNCLTPGTDTTGNGNYTINSAGNVTFAGRTVNAGTGTISLTSATGYSVTASSTLQAAALTVGDTQTISISSGANLTLTTTGTLANAISGAGGVAVGGGVVTLTGTNTATGATTVNAGKLIVTSGVGVGDASAVTVANVAGATLQLNAGETIGSLGGGGGVGGTVNIQGFDLAMGGNNSNTAFSGAISGVGNVTKSGTGTQTLGGTNTTTGSLTVNAGAVNLGNGGVWAGAVQVNAGATLTGTGAILGGGTTLADGASLRPGSAVSGGVLRCSDLTLGNGTNTFNLFDPTVGGVSNSLVTVTNAFTVNNAVIAINPLRPLSNGVYVLFLHTNAMAGVGFNPTVLGNITRSVWSLTNTANAVCLNVAGYIGNLRWDPTVSGNWDVQSSSNWLDGAVKAQYYNGDNVTFDDGGAAINTNVTLVGALNPLSLTVSNTLAYAFTGTGTLTGTGPLLKIGAGTLTLTDTPNIACPMVISNGTVAFNTVATNETYSQVISGTAGKVAKVGSGTLTITGTNTYAGGTTVNAGVLNVGGGGTSGLIPTGSLTVSPGATLVYDFNPGFAPVPLSVTGNLAYVSESGVLSLSGAYEGNQITATSMSNYMDITGNLTINAGAGGATITAASTYGIYSAGLRNITTTGNVTFAGTNTRNYYDCGINAAGVYRATAGTLTFDGTVTSAGGYGIECGFSGGWAGGISTFGNVVFKGTGGTTRNSDLNLGGLTGNGTVTLLGRLKGLNSYVAFSSSGGLPYNVVIQTTAGGINGLFNGGTDTTGNGNYTVNSAGTVVFVGRTVNAGTGTISLTSATGYSVTASSTLQGASLVIGDNRGVAVSTGAILTLNAVGVVSNAISGLGGFAVSGGVIKLTSTNSYSGATTINGGSLFVDGRLGGSGTVTVNSSGTLGGTGVVAGVTTVAAAGTLSPGDPLVNSGIGTITVSNDVVLAATSTNAVQISAGGLADVLVSSGTVTNLGAILSLSVVDNNFNEGAKFTVMTAANIVGTFAGLPNGAILMSGGRRYVVTYPGNTKVVLQPAATGAMVIVQ